MTNQVSLTGKILDSDALRHELEPILMRSHNSVRVISAYVTEPAVHWILRHVPHRVALSLVCRLTPDDVRCGSTSLAALEIAVKNNWEVFCLHSLHAKIYCVDEDDLYVGSANLTTSGLKVSGYGNLEAMVKAEPSKENIDFIYSIFSSATRIDMDTIRRIKAYLGQVKDGHLPAIEWPENVIPSTDGLWVDDFLWSDPLVDNSNESDIDHDLAILKLDDLNSSDLKLRLLTSRCIKWISAHLKSSPGNELYFGEIAKILHSELSDDPAPYRKDVKRLVQNLLGYIQLYLSDIIEVSRPNYSQRVRLLPIG